MSRFGDWYLDPEVVMERAAIRKLLKCTEVEAVTLQAFGMLADRLDELEVALCGQVVADDPESEDGPPD